MANSEGSAVFLAANRIDQLLQALDLAAEYAGLPDQQPSDDEDTGLTQAGYLAETTRHGMEDR